MGVNDKEALHFFETGEEPRNEFALFQNTLSVREICLLAHPQKSKCMKSISWSVSQYKTEIEIN